MSIELSTQRHSLAHILAQAIQRAKDPHVQLGIGPSIDTWSYYDMIFTPGHEVGDDDKATIESTMEKILKEKQAFVLFETSEEISAELLSLTKQQYKPELRAEFLAAGEQVTFYANTIPLKAKEAQLKESLPSYIALYDQVTAYVHQHYPHLQDQYVTFLDMCAGPHIENTSQIASKSFCIEKFAGAYRRGDEKNVMMTRVYLLAFATKDDLKSHQEMMEEAKKRDHRVLGQQLKIFAFDEEVGPGLPLRLPNGSIIVEELERLAKEKEAEYGYQRVRSPHITKESLYIRSGHLPYYADSMFPPMDMDGEKYYLKPMNCPHHHKIYVAVPKSYRDLPVRYAEYGHCYRYEDSGSLMGLMRVRSLCMNDAHIYCAEEQFESEFGKVIELYLYYFKLFGIDKYQMRLSKHAKEKLGEKYVNNPELWIKTEEQVRQVLIKLNIPFVEAEDEAAFYGPKIDVQIRSVIGREFTLATNQLDFAVPERFALTYMDKDGQQKTPICIHRAPLSTHERFIGFLIEHFGGSFPLWLAPVQVIIIPVADKFVDYAQNIKQQAQQYNLRVHIDDSSDSFSKKIRNAEIDKIPYILIVWEKEVADNTVSVRVYKTKEQRTVSIETFLTECNTEYTQRAL